LAPGLHNGHDPRPEVPNDYQPLIGVPFAVFLVSQIEQGVHAMVGNPFINHQHAAKLLSVIYTEAKRFRDLPPLPETLDTIEG